MFSSRIEQDLATLTASRPSSESHKGAAQQAWDFLITRLLPAEDPGADTLGENS